MMMCRRVVCESPLGITELKLPLNVNTFYTRFDSTVVRPNKCFQLNVFGKKFNKRIVPSDSFIRDYHVTPWGQNHVTVNWVI